MFYSFTATGKNGKATSDTTEANESSEEKTPEKTPEKTSPTENGVAAKSLVNGSDTVAKLSNGDNEPVKNGSETNAKLSNGDNEPVKNGIENGLHLNESSTKAIGSNGIKAESPESPKIVDDTITNNEKDSALPTVNGSINRNGNEPEPIVKNSNENENGSPENDNDNEQVEKTKLHKVTSNKHQKLGGMTSALTMNGNGESVSVMNNVVAELNNKNSQIIKEETNNSDDNNSNQQQQEISNSNNSEPKNNDSNNISSGPPKSNGVSNGGGGFAIKISPMIGNNDSDSDSDSEEDEEEEENEQIDNKTHTDNNINNGGAISINGSSVTTQQQQQQQKSDSLQAGIAVDTPTEINNLKNTSQNGHVGNKSTAPSTVGNFVSAEDVKIELDDTTADKMSNGLTTNLDHTTDSRPLEVNGSSGEGNKADTSHLELPSEEGEFSEFSDDDLSVVSSVGPSSGDNSARPSKLKKRKSFKQKVNDKNCAVM